MTEEFLGYKVPGVEQLDELVRGIKKCGPGIIEQIYLEHDCVRCAIRRRVGGLEPPTTCCTPKSINCDDCIYSFHADTEHHKIGVFETYLQSKGYDLEDIKSEVVPKLRPGMICEMADKDHTLVMYLADTAEGRHTGYTLHYFALVDAITVGGVQDFSDQELLAVYADSALEDIGDPMVLEDLKKSLRLRDNPIWEKPTPSVPREMTVEQIESELGYKVKVVGNDKVQS